jgi:hypothetical protein
MTVDGATSWRKARASTDGPTTCVEMVWTGSTVGYRDSKRADGAELWFPVTAARAFISRIRQL